MASAMILAAGLGTRLRPLTDELPKPLVPIGDRPAIAHVLDRLAIAGMDPVVMNTHHLPEAFAAVAASSSFALEVIHEPDLLGTAGGVANAASKLGAGEVLVWNADVIADIDVPGLFAVRAQSGALAALCAAPRPMGQGTLGIDADGRVARLRGHRFGEEVRGGDFLGIQVIGEALRAELPHEGCLVGDVYLPALRRGADLRVLDVHGAWDDIGSVAAYLQANLRWLAARGAPAHIGDGAQLASGVELEASVVGAAAVVDGQGALRRCVVWPGARATAPLEDAVITRAGHVVRG